MAWRGRKKGRCQTDDEGDAAVINFAGAEVRLYVELDQHGEETIIMNFHDCMPSIRPEGANRIRLARQRYTRGGGHRRH